MRYGVLTFFLIVCCCSQPLLGQVGMLSKGNWVKIAVPNEGVYQITGAQLNAVGLTGKLNAQLIQLYGMDLSRLEERVPQGLPDTLTELSIEMQDGGDGILDEQDRFLFYAQGKNKWIQTNPLEAPMRQKITSNDSLYFFLRIGSIGKRINTQNTSSIATKFVKEYPARWLIEKDSINILSSGKTWLGEPMGTGIGKKAILSFPLNMEGLQLNTPLCLQTQLAATTYQTDANFSIKLNDQSLSTISLNPVSGFIFDDAYKLRFDSISIWLDPTKVLKAGQSIASMNLQVEFNAPTNATGWIDYVALHGVRKIGFWNNASFGFDYHTSNPNSEWIEFEIQNATSQTRVWDLSQYLQPTSISVVLGQNWTATFKSKDSAHKFFYVFESNKVNTAQCAKLISNDSIFSNNPVDYIIITATDYYPVAKQLKTFHETQNGYKVAVVHSTQVFNEMASGQTTPIAIRNYIKYLVEQSKIKNQPKPTYLLLLGIGNFNPARIQLNKELPVYTSDVSNSILTSYSTDDFFAIQKPNAHIQFTQTIDSIDLAVGRIPARSIAEASMMLQKIIQYQSSKKMGVWQNQLAWVADDADYNLHLQDAEEIVGNLKAKSSNWNHRKIYLDLFKASQTLTGATYPEVNKAIQETIQGGALLLNYTGHGNYLRLSEEAVISKTEMQQWNNAGKLPIMVTASCDFAPYDQPALSPIGFDALMQNEKGIIALVAANRLVFAYSNKQINDAFMQALLVPNHLGKWLSIGQALQAAKKYNFSKNGDRLNAFKFGLMGDPAMQIAQPKYQIQSIALNQLPWPDTLILNPGGKYKLKGNISNANQIMLNFNGFVDMILWDAPTTKMTLANQTTSQVVAVETQEQPIFKGKATVQNGQFEISFIIPKSMPSSSLSALKLQLYAYNDTADASIQYQSVFIHGAANQNDKDTIGPAIKSYINTPYFKSGDWVSSPANLIVLLKDSSGIQSSGNELGHDLKLIIDDTLMTSYNLNPFFSYDLNQYQSGMIQYTLPNLSAGKHRLILKAWDLSGNLSKDTLWIEVPAEKNKLVRNLTVMPNPVLNAAKFSFEIKTLNAPIQYTLDILDGSGRVFYATTDRVEPSANKLMLHWDGKGIQGGVIPSGIYYYRLRLQQNDLQEELINILLKL